MCKEREGVQGEGGGVLSRLPTEAFLYIVFNSRKKSAEFHSLLVFRLHRQTEVINTLVIFHTFLKEIIIIDRQTLISVLCIVVC